MMRQLDGVLVPPHLCATVARALLGHLAAESTRNGGLRPSPGTAAFLRQLDSVASATPPAPLEPRQLTTAEAALVMGLSPQRVRELAAHRKIIARKIGRDWQIDAQAAGQWRGRRHVTADDDSRGEAAAGH